MDFAKALEDNMNATKTLVNSLVKASGDPQGALSSTGYRECEKATAEVRKYNCVYPADQSWFTVCCSPFGSQAITRKPSGV